MLTYSPSGALSPYHYKGGYFHGIHYGNYFDNSAALFAMMKKEEDVILKNQQSQRIMIDLYETALTDEVLSNFVAHISRMASRIYKLGVSAAASDLKKLEKAMRRANILGSGQVFYSTDMEEAKTWLVH